MATPRKLMIFGPYARWDIAVAQGMIVAFDLETLFVFYSMAQQRPFTPDEVRRAITELE